MQRIQSNDAIHIDGKPMFTEGDAHAEEARGATTITAEFLNTVQEELASFVESQGLELSQNNQGQLVEAHTRSMAKKINPVVRAINHLIHKLGYEEEITQLDEIR